LETGKQFTNPPAGSELNLLFNFPWCRIQ